LRGGLQLPNLVAPEQEFDGEEVVAPSLFALLRVQGLSHSTPLTHSARCWNITKLFLLSLALEDISNPTFAETTYGSLRRSPEETKI
jgi:hypothetical protein